MTNEVRTTSATGAAKGVKPAQFDLLPWGALTEVAEHYAKGAEKYEKHNMRKGYEWSKSFSAAMRHLTQFWQGEDIDAETGSKHLAAVVFHALTMMEFMETHPEYDDRYRPNPQPVDEDVDKLWAKLQERSAKHLQDHLETMRQNENDLTGATFIPPFGKEALRNALANHPKEGSC